MQICTATQRLFTNSVYYISTAQYVSYWLSISYIFCIGNDAMYCTELVYESYRCEDGTPIFHDAPMNFKSSDGTFPVYWVQLFERLGQEIPQGVPGTNPQKMSEEPALRPVAVSLP